MLLETFSSRQVPSGKELRPDNIVSCFWNRTAVSLPVWATFPRSHESVSLYVKTWAQMNMPTGLRWHKAATLSVHMCTQKVVFHISGKNVLFWYNVHVFQKLALFHWCSACGTRKQCVATLPFLVESFCLMIIQEGYLLHLLFLYALRVKCCHACTFPLGLQGKSGLLHCDEKLF